MSTDRGASILPVGTLTFLLTDVEGSTRLWEAAPDVAAGVIERHRELIGSAVSAHGGVLPEEQGEGDSSVAVFESAADAVAAALDAQRRLASEPWPRDLSPRARIGLHTGEALLQDQRRYTGPALHRCARLRDVAHGGQTLLSSTTAGIVAERVPPGCWLEDRGRHRLRDLSRPEQVFELRYDDLAGAFPPLRSVDARANNLPAQLTSFVGREEELATVGSLLAGERLVTLTGSGGCGKTRLAAQAAAEHLDRWPDGVWWVDLSPLTDPTLVASLVTAAVGVLVEPVGGPLRALTLQLRDSRLLLCLDNCEHLLDPSADLVDALLRACPEVTVLATSREPLGVAGEIVWRVPPLTDEEAIALFVERGRRARPWFTVDEGSEPAVRTICRRLDGLPLALELAAAWLRTLTPAQIAAGLDDRFTLLVRGPRAASARQQTLAASIDWSHDLLDETDRLVFRRLAVFAGGFTLDAARAVCADRDVDPDEVLGALASLVDQSLVVMDDHDDVARYRLLETIRAYASDKLHAAGEATAVRERHLDHYLAFAEAAEPLLESADQDTWLGRLEVEHDNLRAALDLGLTAPDPERGRRLAAALVWLWRLHGHSREGTELLRRAIERVPDDRSPLQARLLTGIAWAADTTGPSELEAARRGLEIATVNGDDRVRGRSLLLSAFVQFFVDFEAARELSVQAQECAEAVGDHFVADSALVLQGVIASYRDRHDTARPLLQRGLERCRRRGDRGRASWALAYLDATALRTGDVRLAEQLAAEALRIAEPLGDYFTVGFATSHLAHVRGLRGDIAGGRRLMDKVVRSVVDADDSVYVPHVAPVMGRLSLWDGDLEDALEWFERDVRAADPATDNLMVAEALPGLGDVLRRVGRREEARHHLDRAVAMNRELDVPHLLAEALEQLAHVAALDEPDRAEDLHHEALAVRVDHGLRTSCVDSLDALAHLSHRAGQSVEAVRLLAASDAARQAIGCPRPPVDRRAHDTVLRALREGLGDVDFAQAWRDGGGLSLDAAVAYARRSRGSRGRPSAGWASLTPTELDVVRCVVEGLTNPEIAARLFMSRSTVKTHLSHIYAKLTVANRVELSAFAMARMTRS